MTTATLNHTIDDIHYLRHGDRALLLRLFRPAAAGPFPLMVDLHGGCWSRGDPGECRLRDDLLCEAGIAAAASGKVKASSKPRRARLKRGAFRGRMGTGSYRIAEIESNGRTSPTLDSRGEMPAVRLPARPLMIKSAQLSAIVNLDRCAGTTRTGVE